MILDTSAIIAILRDEPLAAELKRKLLEAQTVLLSACSYLEASIVATRLLGEKGMPSLQQILDLTPMDMRPFDSTQAVVAVNAHLQFGKGRHLARLNFGDCFVYALAMATGLPILCTGDDFSKTDALIA